MSLAVIIAPQEGQKISFDFVQALEAQVRLPDEVILVHCDSCDRLELFCSSHNISFLFRQSVKPATRRFNLGISFASSLVVCLLDGRESFASTFFQTIQRQVYDRQMGCVLFKNATDRPTCQVLTAFRECFVYGPLDERFEVPRFAIVHWFTKIYPRAVRRVARIDGATEVVFEDLSGCDRLAIRDLKNVILAWPFLLGWKQRLKLLFIALCKSDRGTWFFVLQQIGVWILSFIPSDPYHGNKRYQARSFWETNTRAYLKWEIYQPDEKEIQAMLTKTCPSKVLELGCGAGRNFRFYDKETQCVGLDLAQNLLLLAQDKVSENIRGLVCGSATQICFSDGVFDLVFSNSTIQHVPPEEIETCVTEIIRVSKKYVCLIEFTREENEDSHFFSQIHCFQHDYLKLFEDRMDLIYRKEVNHKIQPAIKEVFIFEKKNAI